MVWYSHLLRSFPQFVVIYTVKAFGVVNKAELDVFFLELLLFSMIQWMMTIWCLVTLLFLNSAGLLEIHGSRTTEAWLAEFWALVC